jgi:anti-sigma factor RsiW
MSTCDPVRVSLSAAFDGEIARHEVSSLLVHVAGCAGCAEFVRRCGALDDVLAGHRLAHSSVAMATAWSTIVRRAERTTATRRWLAAASIAALLVLSGWSGWALRDPRPQGLASLPRLDGFADRVRTAGTAAPGESSARQEAATADGMRGGKRQPA